MRKLHFVLEEPSIEIVLRNIMPRIAPAAAVRGYRVYSGKYHLLKELPFFLKGYTYSNTTIVVMFDRDCDDCRALKARIQAMADEAGQNDILIRIVCPELESWYLGDLPALQLAYPRMGIDTPGHRERYSDPEFYDKSKEEFTRLCGRGRQLERARRISPHLDVENNRSESFNAFVAGIKRVLSK